MAEEAPAKEIADDAVAQAEAQVAALKSAVALGEVQFAGLEHVIRVQDPKISTGKVKANLAKIIIWFYVATVAMIALYLIYRGVFFKEDVTTHLFDLVKTAIIPIVTFVIGHYYGSNDGSSK